VTGPKPRTTAWIRVSKTASSAASIDDEHERGERSKSREKSEKARLKTENEKPFFGFFLLEMRLLKHGETTGKHKRAERE